MGLDNINASVDLLRDRGAAQAVEQVDRVYEVVLTHLFCKTHLDKKQKLYDNVFHFSFFHFTFVSNLGCEFN